MNPVHRETFVSVVRHGSIRDAIQTDRLNLEDAAVRKQLRLLEAEAGKKLFSRSPRGLTSFGREYFRAIDPLLARIEQLEQTLFRNSGTLRIGVSAFIDFWRVRDVVQVWCERHPQAHIVVTHGFPSELRDALLARDLDVAVLTCDARMPAGLASRVLVSRPLTLLVPDGSDIVSSAQIWSEKSLREGARLIVPPAAEPLAECFERGLHRGGISWPVRTEVPSLEAMKACVAAKQGVGLMLEPLPTADQPLPPEIRMLPLPGFDSIPIVAFWRASENSRLKGTLPRAV